MNKKLKFGVCCFTSLIFISLILVGTLNVYAGGAPEPPTGTERESGPRIEGTLTGAFNPSTNSADFKFSGKCKNMSVTLGPMTYPNFDATKFAALKASDLIDKHAPKVGPKGCHSKNGGEDLILNRVNTFTNTGTISADVVIMFVLPR